MPQMAIEALSENWLFKELGGGHWEMICNGLNTKSFDLTDEIGNRLYATFIRIRINCNLSLASFTENETIHIDGSIKRYGLSMYQSQFTIQGNKALINAELLTSFSVRNDSDNQKLVKSQPANIENHVPEFENIPTFANEYRLLKKGQLNELLFHNFTFKVTQEVLYETVYEINPYYDVNGVGLLYFASYPVINDFCEAKYFNQQKEGLRRFELDFSTAHKDLFYFANCNLNDAIIYRLHSLEILRDGQLSMSSSLWRASDEVLLARIFSIKARKDSN
jgi:probable biosynthetic protein (TIGR04098 family)